MAEKCVCNVIVGYISGGEHRTAEVNHTSRSYDVGDEYLYRKCPVHPKKSDDFWDVGTLEEFGYFVEKSNFRFTKEGMTFLLELVREYGEKYPEVKRLAEVHLRIGELSQHPKTLAVNRVDEFTGEVYRTDYYKPREVSLELERLVREKDRILDKYYEKARSGKRVFIDPYYFYRAFKKGKESQK